MGGGHGPFTNIFGLGSDNVLELEVVLPSTGEIVIANENSYPDLFWALRGGGGGTFGIVTKVTMKTHPQVSLNAIHVTIRPNVDIESDAGKAAWAKAMAYVLTSMPDINDFGISGHPIMQATAFDTLWSAPGKTAEEIKNFMDPYMETLQDTYGVKASFTSLASGIMTMMANLAILPNSGIPNRDPEGPAIMASRLLGRKSMRNFAAVENAIRYIFDKEYVCEPFNVGGGAAADKRIKSGLNPAWRDSVIHFSILPTGQGDMDTVGKVKGGYASLDGAIRVLDSISEGSGSYLNEVSLTQIDLL
jgi:FAD/FMN-containing dehydrogenase